MHGLLSSHFTSHTFPLNKLRITKRKQFHIWVLSHVKFVISVLVDT